MNKVLIIAYYFPPLGMGGTQRVAKFANYLHEFGWEPTVVTVKPISYWAQDESLLDELQHVRIIRTESMDPQRLLQKYKKGESSAQKSTSTGKGLIHTINQKIIPFFLIPDSKILWWNSLRRKVDELLKAENFDALFTTAPPHSVNLMGYKIAKKYNIPWVADFRDAWAGGVVVHEPSFIQKIGNRRMQFKTVKHANAVISVTPAIQSELVQNQYPEKFTTIYNGFDDSDFPKPQNRDDEKFVICHCGSITKFSYPKEFLAAVKKVTHENPDLAKKLKIEFIGRDTNGDFMDFVQQYGLHSIIDYYDYLPHHQALHHVVNADALLLIARGQKDDHFVPGKTFEYLGSKKRILALTNISDTVDVLSKTDQAIVDTSFEVDSIAKNIKELIYNDWQCSESHEKYVEQFHRKKQTEQLGTILSKITE